MTQDKNNLQTPKHLFHGLKFHHRCEVVVDLKAPRPPHMPDSEDRMLMSGVSIHAIISSIVCEYFSVAQCLQNWHEVAISYGHLPSYWWYLHEAIAHVKLVRGNLYYWCDRFKTLQEDSFLLNICSIVVSLLSAMKPVKSEVDDFHLSSHRRIFKLVLNWTTEQQEQQSQEMASIVVWAMCGDDIKYEVTSWHICTLLCLGTRVVCCNTEAICTELLLQLSMFVGMNIYLCYE